MDSEEAKVHSNTDQLRVSLLSLRNKISKPNTNEDENDDRLSA